MPLVLASVAGRQVGLSGGPIEERPYGTVNDDLSEYAVVSNAAI